MQSSKLGFSYYMPDGAMRDAVDYGETRKKKFIFVEYPGGERKYYVNSAENRRKMMKHMTAHLYDSL